MQSLFTTIMKELGLGFKVPDAAGASGDEQRGKVTPYHIPTEDAFEKKQEHHLDQETGYRRKIEDKESLPESAIALLYNAALPYPEIGPQEVAHHRKLEGDDGRKDIASPIGSEDIVL